MKIFFDTLCRLLEAGETVSLLSIVKQQGSTPREAGVKMLVRADGHIVGTIGGGAVEAASMFAGQQLIANAAGSALLLNFDLTNEEAANAAMVCGGRVSVLIERVGKERLAEYTNVKNALEQAHAVDLITSFNFLPAVDMHELANTFVNGELEGNAPSIRRARAAACQVALPALKKTHCPESLRQEEAPKLYTENETEATLHECFTPQAALYIWGAGHVAQPTAKIGALLGFSVFVLDDRADLLSAERFPNATRILLKNYEQSREQVRIGAKDFVVIMTRGHLHDGEVLDDILQSNAHYIGMIGSKRKRDALYAALRAAGKTEADLARCHCPIGLELGAQTPEEIAVSIAAELVQVRNG